MQFTASRQLEHSVGCTCVYIYRERAGFVCKPIKEYKLVNLIIVVDQNNQGLIWIHRKYENMKYMESQLLWKYGNVS